LIREWALGADSYLEYLSRVVEGEYPVSTPDLTNYLYLPGRTGGQAGTQSDASFPYLTLTQHASATSTAGALLKLIGKNASSSAVTSGTLIRAATSDDVTIFSLLDDASITINVPYTTYTSGNPVALTLQMTDATGVSGDNDFFKITTNGTDVLTVGYFGLFQIDMTANDVAMFIDQSLGSTSDYMRFGDGSSAGNPRGSAVKLGINSAGDLYGGTVGSSTLLLMSNNLAASSTSRISLLSTSTDITFDCPAGSVIPFRFGIGLVSGSLTGLSAAINLTSVGGNPGSMSVSNVAGSNASVLYKAIRIATQTGDMFECLDSNGSTLLSAFNSAGAYRLVAGAAAGSVLTSDANGVGSWSTIAALTASFADNLFSIFDNVTPAKIAAFQLDGLTAGTHTYRPPPSTAATTVTLAAIDVAQTWLDVQKFGDGNIELFASLDTSKRLTFDLGSSASSSNLTLAYTTNATRTLTWNLNAAAGIDLTLSWAGTLTDKTVTIPDATFTIAGLQIAQTFSKAQTITPDSDAVALRLTDLAGGGGVANIFQVYDSASAGDFFQIRPFSDPGGLPGAHFAVSSAIGVFLTLWSSATVGTGFKANVGTLLLTADRTFSFPDTTGTILTRVGSVNISTARKTTIAAGTAFVGSALVTAGMWQINAYALCTTAGTDGGTLTVNVTLTDDNGSKTIPVIAGFLLATAGTSLLSHTNATQAFRLPAGTAITYGAVHSTSGGANAGFYKLFLRATQM
jgi:hypothetical protein